MKQLIDKERDLVREIQSLDSEMQTLVYENYNKFILATDTIRQMKSDFKVMEDEMEKLVSDMSNIATFANDISSNLQVRYDFIVNISKGFYQAIWLLRIAGSKSQSFPTFMSFSRICNFCSIYQKI